MKENVEFIYENSEKLFQIWGSKWGLRLNDSDTGKITHDLPQYVNATGRLFFISFDNLRRRNNIS